MNLLKHIFSLSLITLSFVAISSCDGTKFVEGNDLLLSQNNVVSSDKNVSVHGLSSYIRQKTNTKWFSTLKVPLGIYSMAGRDTTKAINRRLKKWGEAPVVLDSSLVAVSCNNLQGVMQNRGYLDAEVMPIITTKNKRATVTYYVTPNQQYTLRSVKFDIADSRIDTLLRNNYPLDKDFKIGDKFSINELYSARNKITTWLNDHGYYYFNKENITFFADSSKVDKTVDITMLLGLYRKSSRDSLAQHPCYTIRNVDYSPIPGQELNIRQSTLESNNLIESGDLYSSKKVQQTYNKYARLKAIRSTNIHFNEVPDSNLLDVNIQVARRKPHSIQIQPEGTNTSGDFGAALSVTYENRNIFHGSEQLSVQLRGAFEAIRGLEGYENSNYWEFGAETKLTFPKFIMPWLSRKFHRSHDATTEFPITYNIQSRPEFHRNVLTTSWRYRWNSYNGRVWYVFDLLDLNFIKMPWISETFRRDYIDSETRRNAILRYNYEDLFIMKIGFAINYSDEHNLLRTNVETAGNILYGLANAFDFKRNDLGQYKVANVAFAQYVKFDADYTHLFKLDHRNTLALHSRIGIAIPYGNSSMIPFEKHYFAGGANSVRGWNVRTLGPGGFIGTDGRIDFINQTGDIKLDLNAELRTDLFWKFQGALFIDAGNIWTIRTYNDQPDGYFKLKSLYDEMAVSYGVGLRLNFDYFILRLDLGMKAINPAYTNNEEHFPIAHHNFSRDYALHFAVGLPF